ncbi:MAG: cytochrome c3 family protein [Chthoniobacterales bacterium]
MDDERGSQKEIAQRYRGRVDYSRTKSRARRWRFWLSCLAVAGGIAAIGLVREKSSPNFFNTGPLSRSHRALANNCVACHEPESLRAGSAGGAPFLQVLNDRFRNGAPSFPRIDQACQTCHQHHAFHEANVVENQSCSACHEEHQGPEAMRAVTTLQCATCHNDRALMQASAQIGKRLPSTQFRLNPKVAGAAGTHHNILKLPRPPDGYTVTFASFAEGHPPFQLQRENVRESDVLRFNHQRHLGSSDIPPTKDGKKLDCVFCHQPEPDGRYMRRINFESHCQQCHSLQFDVKNPGFQLPHGDAALVRTFLRTLPAQYGELARREKKMTNDGQIAQFAGQQVRQLLGQYGSGAELERAVFFATNPYKVAAQSDAATRARYAGCAFCHEVKQGSAGAFPVPEITRPVTIDRWMPHASFSHARHESVLSCRECHVAAEGSRLTSDVLMPVKEGCVICHSETAAPLKRASAECSTCHVFHAPDPRAPPGTTARASFFPKTTDSTGGHSSTGGSSALLMKWK